MLGLIAALRKSRMPRLYMGKMSAALSSAVLQGRDAGIA
jgi:hypothetical protein